MTKVVQTRKTTIFGGGITSSATSIVLSSLVLPDGTTTVTMADFGTTGYATIEPATSREEQISFTGITQNANGTATLTGVTRGVNFVSPFDEVSAYKLQHSGGSTVVFSNTAGFYNKFSVTDEDETITGEFTFTTPPKSTGTATDNNDLMKKSEVEAIVNGGPVSNNRIVISGNAGETVVAGNVLYFNTSDQEWYKADADSEYVENQRFGIAQGSGTNGNSITNGVLIFGLDSNQTGLTPGSLYYASGTAGSVTSTPPTNSYFVGVAASATSLVVDFDTNRRLPAGTIQMYGSSTAPVGWLNCDGTEVSRTTYAALFGSISTSYGSGNGSTTFNLPDLRGRFPLGYSASAPTKTLTFSSRSSNTITVTGVSNTNNNEIQTGQAVLYDTTSGVITGLTDNTTYYLIRVAYNQFQLATSVANANAGTAITLSSDGSGTQTFTATYSARAMGDMGGEETHALTDLEMPSHVHGGVIRSSGGSSGAGSSDDLAGSTDSAGSDAVHNNMPLFTTVNFIIKT